MRTIVLEAACMTEREQAHEYLKEKLELPEYYGRNLDALFDCLTDVNELRIVLSGRETAQGYFTQVERVLRAAEQENECLQIVDNDSAATEQEFPIEAAQGDLPETEPDDPEGQTLQDDEAYQTEQNIWK